MRDFQAQQPIHSAKKFTFLFFKIAFLKIISTRILFGAIVKLGKRFGKNVDDILGGMTRGFSDNNLLLQLRQQPNSGTLRLLKHRLETYDSRRITRRTENAQRLITKLRLEKSQPELLDSRHTFWLFPFITDHPEALMKFLREHGFDTTQRGRLEIVPPPTDRPELSSPMATELLSQTGVSPLLSRDARRHNQPVEHFDS